MIQSSLEFQESKATLTGCVFLKSERCPGYFFYCVQLIFVMQPISIFHFLLHLNLSIQEKSVSHLICSIRYSLTHVYSVNHASLSSLLTLSTPFFLFFSLISLNLVQQGLFVYFLPQAFHMKSENCKLKKYEPKKRSIGLKTHLFSLPIFLLILTFLQILVI